MTIVLDLDLSSPLVGVPFVLLPCVLLSFHVGSRNYPPDAFPRPPRISHEFQNGGKFWFTFLPLFGVLIFPCAVPQVIPFEILNTLSFFHSVFICEDPPLAAHLPPFPPILDGRLVAGG